MKLTPFKPPIPCTYTYTEYFVATKTISIDTEAYRRLKSVKQKNESFSQTIKRVVQQPIDFERWMALIGKDPLSDEAIEAVEAVISQRRIPRNRRRLRGAS
jgi:predicted CopG family antitoxin